MIAGFEEDSPDREGDERVGPRHRDDRFVVITKGRYSSFSEKVGAGVILQQFEPGDIFNEGAIIGRTAEMKVSLICQTMSGQTHSLSAETFRAIQSRVILVEDR